MNTETFNKLLDELDGKSLDTMKKKNAKYNPANDSICSFKSGADIMGSTPAQCAWGYMTKHLVALRDMVQRDSFSDRDDFLEKCQDIINYIRFIWIIGNDNMDTNYRGQIDIFKKKVDNLYPIKIDDEYFYVQKEVYDFIWRLKTESDDHIILITDLEACIIEFIIKCI